MAHIPSSENLFLDAVPGLSVGDPPLVTVTPVKKHWTEVTAGGTVGSTRAGQISAGSTFRCDAEAANP